MLLRGKPIASILMGAAFGALASVSNQVETPISFILNAGWAWAGIMVLSGWIAGTVRTGAIAGVLSAISAVLAYYIADTLFLVAPFADFGLEIGYWVVTVLIMGPGMGVIGSLVKGRGLSALLAGVVVPLGATIEMIWLPRWVDGIENSNLTMARVLVWVSAALATAILVRRYARDRAALMKGASAGIGEGRDATRFAKRVPVLFAVATSFLAVAAIGIAPSLDLSGERYSSQLTESQDAADVIMRATVTEIHEGVRDASEINVVTVAVEGSASYGAEPTAVDGNVVIEIPSTDGVHATDLRVSGNYILFLKIHADGRAMLVDPTEAVFEVTSSGALSNRAGLELPPDVLASLGLA